MARHDDQQGNCRPARQSGAVVTPRAFTLIELLVVIAIIAILVGIILPSLATARDRGFELKCLAYMREFGSGFASYSVANDDYFCSGSFDPEISNGRDGPVDQVGWVADLVNSNTAFPGRMLCPTNIAKYNQKLGPSAGPDAYTPERAQELVRDGYNTNYGQSWYMARTEWNPQSGDFNIRRVSATFGALNGGRINTDTSRVPLLGDGRSDYTDAQDYVLGERAVKTMTDGPFGGPYGTQDYTDFGLAHGRGAVVVRDKNSDRTRGNMLFADGHAASMTDWDRDGEFGLNTRVRPAVQLDLGSDVFDGVLSVGRRSLGSFSIQ